MCDLYRTVHCFQVYHREAEPRYTGHLKDVHETMFALLLFDDDPLLRHGLHSWLERVSDNTVMGKPALVPRP